MIIGDSEVCPGPVEGADGNIGIGIGGAGEVVISGTGTKGCKQTAGGAMPFVEVACCPRVSDRDSSSRTGGRATPFGGGRGVVVNGPDIAFTLVPGIGAGVPPLPVPPTPPLFGLPLPLPRPPLPPSFSPLILSFKNLTI
jgi:hypothetical protein